MPFPYPIMLFQAAQRGKICVAARGFTGLFSAPAPVLPITTSHNCRTRICRGRRLGGQLVTVEAYLHRERELAFGRAARAPVQTNQLAVRDRVFHSAVRQESDAVAGERHRLQTFGHVGFVEPVQIEALRRVRENHLGHAARRYAFGVYDR